MEDNGLGNSLFAWINSFPDTGKSEQWHDLSDGRQLWAILQEVDGDYFAGELPEEEVTPSSDWTRKWQNLKHLDRQLSTYYRDVCNGADGVAGDYVPDLKAAAAEGAPHELEKLIMVMIRAAMASPESNQKMAHKLMSLGREKAMVIAGELRRMEEAAAVDYSESEPMSRDESAYQSEQEEATPQTKANGKKAAVDATYGDPLFEREEELLQAQVTISKLQASQEAAQRQLAELREDKERLQEAFDAYRVDIDSKGRSKGASEVDDVKKLQRQAENDRSYIDDLERQMQSSRDSMDAYEKQIERLKADNEASQRLRDDVQMLKADNEELAQKVRANENLKKKIQSLQEAEKVSASLQEELKTANERLTEMEKLKQVQAGLEKEIIEKKGLIRNQEYQINELITTRKHAEHDARILAQKLEAARERHDRDHEALEEMRGRLQDEQLVESVAEETPLEQKTPVAEQPKATDESKAWREKVALLEQQLETSDTRLKRLSDRNATLEEEQRGAHEDSNKYQQLQQTLDQQKAEHERAVEELRKQLESAQKQPPAPEADPKDIAALKKENRLMSSAWHDLAGRLQRNDVTVGRRKYEPKSWIGKQRQMVGPTIGLAR